MLRTQTMHDFQVQSAGEEEKSWFQGGSCSAPLSKHKTLTLSLGVGSVPGPTESQLKGWS